MTTRIDQTDRRRQRNDSQLLLTLLVQIAFYAVFTMPYHCTLIAAAVEPSFNTQPTFVFIQHVAIITLNFNQAVSDDFYKTFHLKATYKYRVIAFY